MSTSEKDFDGWNRRKKMIHEKDLNLIYHQGEIWWCHLGINIGFEEDGSGESAERPVLIVRRFSKYLCWAIPLSTSQKNNPYYVPAGMVDDKVAAAMISQMRPIDTKRLINQIGVMDPEFFYQIKKAAKGLL